ncbi:hypothetical protein ACMD2_15426 [Ananas comosus]|uniref:Uncharacterized protein n=1 Tax=Ananas comosus TaxID=4615 RepID=A0A199W2Z3_ANACO|nr:hypothetical protein ACMD2_15426 [Ananas comosus]
MASSPSLGDAPVKVEKEEENDEDKGKVEEDDDDDDEEEEGEHGKNVVSFEEHHPAKPSRGPYKRPLGRSAPGPTLAVNRRRLGRLLARLARAHNWTEASGVLSLLLKGTPRGSSLLEDRRNFLVAMEIQKRLGRGSNYQLKIKKMYEIWMSKLAWTKKCSKKVLVFFFNLCFCFIFISRCLIQLELAFFYLSQGNVQEAHNTTKFLVQDRECATEPTVNLIHGLILYHLWYSSLPEDMQIKGFDIQTSSEVNHMAFNDSYEEADMLESSEDHDAVNIEDNKFSSHCASESSIGNNKGIFMDYKSDAPRKQSNVARPANDFYISGSEMNAERAASPNLHSNFQNTSIFLARGLDKTLLPIQLKHLDGDLEQSIYLYRKLANENYKDAVKHLRLALHSTAPVMAALLPLIQLLLLGDRVEEALAELENSCLSSTAAISFRSSESVTIVSFDCLQYKVPITPVRIGYNNNHPSYRLRARLLECFYSNQATTISSCYEDALKRDPTCIYTLERLIKMHKTGSYITIQLMEMIALHLDSADGKSNVWEEFASCFLKLLTAGISDYEDCISTNIQGDFTNITSSNKIPKVFTVGRAKETWKVRCRWWVNRHFSKNAFLAEIQAGDWKLLASKAACASHLYGPKFEYVKAVWSSLVKEGGANLIKPLHTHILNTVKLHENLEGDSSKK